MSKVAVAWDKLFTDLDILKHIDENDYYILDSKTIKEITGEEPRHMGNIYNTNKLPLIFADNDINMLPIANGKYCLGRFETYECIPTELQPVERIVFNTRIKSLKLKDLKTEEDATAYIGSSPQLMNYINPTNEDCLISGGKRTSTSQFSFGINNYSIDIKKVQFEVDSYFEFESKIVILEAKAATSKLDSFFVRQLYYPYRFFYDMNTGKDIVPIFMVFHPKTKIYSFYKYRFTDPMRYDSIELIERKDFKLINSNATIIPIKIVA